MMKQKQVCRANLAALYLWRTASPSMRERLGLPRPNIDALVNENTRAKKSAREIDNDNALNLLRLKRANMQNGAQGAARGFAELLEPSDWDRTHTPARFHAFKRWRRAYLTSIERAQK